MSDPSHDAAFTELARTVAVARTWDRGEAWLIRQLMESYGIPCRFVSSVPHNLFPIAVDELAAIEIVVPDDRAAEARRLLAEHLRQGLRVLRGGRSAGRDGPLTRSRTPVVASAPSRIDLAGGTLDIWPISALVPGARTVNLAIDLPARVEVAPRGDRSLRVVSEDRKRGATRRLPLTRGDVRGSLSLLLRLAAHVELGRGATLVARASAPAGAGLGGSSTLAVAATAALARFAGRRIGRETLLRRVMNLEAAEIGVPTGNQDYLAAIHGGLAAYHHEPDGVRREPLPGARAVAERLVLAYTGKPRASGFSNWDMFRRFIEGDRRAVEAMKSIGRIAAEMADALREGDLDACGRLLGAEGRLRNRLAPSVSTEELERCAAAAREAGAIGTKVCGAGGGGCLVAFAGIGRSADVARAFEACGARVLPVRAARRGVRVEALSARAAGS